MKSIPDKYHLSREDSIFLAKKYLKDSVYRSAFLEGIAVTFPHTSANAPITQDIPSASSRPSATDLAITIMLHIMRSQPFLDGNKRVATLACNKILVQYGCGIFSFPPELKESFTAKLINYYQSSDMDTLKTFIFDRCLTGL